MIFIKIVGFLSKYNGLTIDNEHLIIDKIKNVKKYLSLIIYKIKKMNIIKKTVKLDDDREIIIETGKLAKQADGSVVVKQGNTMLLATVVSARKPKEGLDFLPLSVEYQEKFASNGKIPGGFLKREGRPSDNEILTSRLVDRVLRPLFPKDYHCETFVSIYLISADKDIIPDALVGLAASTAISVSDLPFNGPISEVRVGRIDGEFVVNPTFSQLEKADIDIMVGATKENIMMVEGEMSEVSEKEMLEAMKLAHESIKIQCEMQEELKKEINKTTREYEGDPTDDELEKLVKAETYDKVYEVASKGLDKTERAESFTAIRDEFIEKSLDAEAEGYKDKVSLAKKYFHDVEKEAVRKLVIEEGKRLDGRGTKDIRDIWCEVNYLPSAHGSAIFTRGETQSLTTVTLGSKMDEKMVDNALFKGFENFMLHYNFPPFSTGDARPVRGVSRREVGHGNLAHRSLKKVLPSAEDNPYTIRIVSDILESNGSSSMATVCAGTLALMDAGVKIKKPVSGIAMGLIKENDKYAVLSDILGDEDHLGDMDFKVTGTKDGITACQMDIKVDGLSYQILEEALEQAKEGRMHILSKMTEVIEKPNENYKDHTPRIETVIIKGSKIGAVIGPGGKVIKEIQSSTNTIITIEESDDKGIVKITSSSGEEALKAKEIIKGIVAEPEIGKVYTGKIKKILEFGAFVEILPGKEGLLHISEISHKRLQTVEEELKEGEEVEVKLLEVDKRSGKMRLSRKALLEK